MPNSQFMNEVDFSGRIRELQKHQGSESIGWCTVLLNFETMFKELEKTFDQHRQENKITQYWKAPNLITQYEQLEEMIEDNIQKAFRAQNSEAAACFLAAVENIQKICWDRLEVLKQSRNWKDIIL